MGTSTRFCMSVPGGVNNAYAVQLAVTPETLRSDPVSLHTDALITHEREISSPGLTRGGMVWNIYLPSSTDNLPVLS
jgi:hypothetical protein